MSVELFLRVAVTEAVLARKHYEHHLGRASWFSNRATEQSLAKVRREWQAG